MIQICNHPEINFLAIEERESSRGVVRKDESPARIRKENRQYPSIDKHSPTWNGLDRVY